MSRMHSITHTHTHTHTLCLSLSLSLSLSALLFFPFFFFAFSLSVFREGHCRQRSSVVHGRDKADTHDMWTDEKEDNTPIHGFDASSVTNSDWMILCHL